MRRGRIWSWALVGLSACGGQVPPPPPPLAAQDDAEATAAPRRPYAETMLPSNAAPEVPGLWVRLGAPRRTLDKLPSMVRDLPELVPVSSLDSQTSSPYGAAVAAVIDLSQPVDIAMDIPSASLLDLTPTWAFRVRSPEAVLQGTAGLTLQRLSAGVWNIAMPWPPPARELDPKQEFEEEAEEEYDGEPEDLALPPPVCQLRHLPEPVGYRVLCSARMERLEHDSAFLTAAARDAAPPLDARAELGGPEYRNIIEKRQRQLEEQVDVPGDSSARAVGNLMSRITSSVLLHDQLGAEVELRGEQAHGQLELRFSSKIDAPLLNTWLEHGGKAQLPASCSRLPRDAAFAGCFSGLGDVVARELVESMMTLMNEELEITAPDYVELSAALSGALPPGGQFSIACGVDAGEAFRALTAPSVTDADEASRPLSTASVAALNAALSGWCAIGVDENADRYLAAAQRLYRANQLNTPRKTPEINRRSQSTLKQKRAPLGLPKKTQHYVDENRPDPKYQQATTASAPPLLPYDMHVLIVPDGERAWIVSSRSEKVAAARARSLAGPPDPTQTWPELARFEGKPALGFLAIDFAAAEAIAVDWDSKAQRASAREAVKTALVTSGKARKHVPFWLDVVPRADESGHSVRLRTEFPLFAMLGDLAASASAEGF